jgi:hypothetical protein
VGYFPFVPAPVTAAQLPVPLALTSAAPTQPLITFAETGDANPRLELLANGNILQGVGTSPPTGTIAQNAGGLNISGPGAFAFKAVGSVDAGSAGFGLKVAEGSNAKQGTATLSGGTVTVANTSVTASSRIFLTSTGAGGATSGALCVSAVVAGTSFTVTSTLVTDASTFNYEIFEPG